MNQEEFLKELQQALQGQISDEELINHLEYYNTYISQEMKNGRTQQEIIEQLGSPRLIAKSILDAKKASDESQEYEYEYEKKDDKASEYEKVKGFHAAYDENKGWDIRYGKIKLNSWYFGLFILAIVCIVFFIVFQIFVFLLPILIPIILILMVLGWIIERPR